MSKATFGSGRREKEGFFFTGFITLFYSPAHNCHVAFSGYSPAFCNDENIASNRLRQKIFSPNFSGFPNADMR
jgi:hypothetical protein